MHPTARSTVRSLAVATLAALPAALAHAQTAAPRRAEQAHAWYQYFHEHRLDPRWSLLAEAQFRRADVPGTTPQQLLLRTGVQRLLAAGASVAAGYAFAGTSVYGELPAAAPTDEHRIWQQLTLAHRTGAVAWSHRFRAEQRWIEQTTSGNPWRFRQRARAFTRATVDAPALGVAIPRAYVTPWAELFVTVGASASGQVFDQSRLALQAGYRLTPRFRVEAGYMQQYIQRGGGAATENNHTLVVSAFATTGRR
jgi:hypothetical protein